MVTAIDAVQTTVPGDLVVAFRSAWRGFRSQLALLRPSYDAALLLGRAAAGTLRAEADPGTDHGTAQRLLAAAEAVTQSDLPLCAATDGVTDALLDLVLADETARPPGTWENHMVQPFLTLQGHVKAFLHNNIRLARHVAYCRASLHAVDASGVIERQTLLLHHYPFQDERAELPRSAWFARGAEG